MILSAAPAIPPGTLLERSQSLFGLLSFILICFIIGRLRGVRSFPVRVVVWGVILQFAFGAVVVFSPDVLRVVQDNIERLLGYSNAGARLIFGSLVDWVAPVKSDDGKTVGIVTLAASFAFSVLPTIVFVSMLTAILYHVGVLTWVVHGLAWIMRRTMGCSGAETLSTAANIFVGQTEAPLIVRPFLAGATRSEMMAIMVGGFANIATGVLVVYTDLLKDHVQNVGGHLAAACFISAPATLLVSKLIMPERETPQTVGGAAIKVERADANLIDAATRGTSEGVTLAINVGAMLIAFTALIALINSVIGSVGGWVGMPGVSLERMLGVIASPLAWLCGIPWADSHTVGGLIGMKTVLNEFIAYNEMGQQFRTNAAYLSPRSALIATYALCGFANFASVGIQIGGISVLAPSRRSELSRIGLLAMAGGAIASMMGACVVGVLI
ncbi:MAG TPA: nucleoside transporter C-terminal domain-containing protein [Tepidisphaeraceae bacterium]|nr:nucleoside transporter C-terminal domain-containing protein [Tepidisphaeraceae bacterium]